MKTAAVAFGLALGANAAPRPSYNPGECCFSINAWGAIGTGKGFLGQVKQLPDGQLRIGQTNLKSPSRFCLDRYNYGEFLCASLSLCAERTSHTSRT